MHPCGVPANSCVQGEGQPKVSPFSISPSGDEKSTNRGGNSGKPKISCTSQSGENMQSASNYYNERMNELFMKEKIVMSDKEFQRLVDWNKKFLFCQRMNELFLEEKIIMSDEEFQGLLDCIKL